MGCSSLREGRDLQLKVGTLNYRTLTSSPFEFYQREDKSQQLLNLQMKKMVQAEQKNRKEFDFQFSFVDKNWKRGRYSPLYLKECGIMCDGNDGKDYLMGECEFREEWEKAKQQMAKQNKQEIEKSYAQYKKLKTKGEKKSLEQLFENLKVFDLLVYKSIIYQLYREESEKEYRKQNFEVEGAFKLDATKYKNYMDEKFDRCYLQQEKKKQKMIDAIFQLQLDILFVQQVTDELVKSAEKQLEGYRIIKCEKHKKLMTKSIIIVRLLNFPELSTYAMQNNSNVHNIDRFRTRSTFEINSQLNQMNCSSDTVIQFIDNMILMCMNVNQMRELNNQIIDQLKANLKLLGERFPDCHIILAGNLNCDQFNSKDIPYTCKGLDNEEIIKYFNVFPNYKQNFTSYMKRTMLQTQIKKSGQLLCAAKDYIVTDMRITQAKVLTIDGFEVIHLQKLKQIENRREKGTNKISDLPQNQLPFIPNGGHPYDRFLVVAKILLPDNRV